MLLTSVEDNESINRYFLTKKGNYLWEKVGIENKSFDFIVDTGSPVSIISSSIYYTHLRKFSLIPTMKTIAGLSGHIMEVKGEVSLPIKCCDVNRQVKFLVFSNSPLLLGLDLISSFKLNNILQTTKAEIPNYLYKQIVHLGKTKME